MKYAKNVLELIGNTPIVKIDKLSKRKKANIFAKCEFLNPTHSVKDRIAKAMIEDAIDSKLITKNSVIVEPTSGNTGIGLASVCASLNLQLTLTMPSSMSVERQKILKSLGANVVLTPAELGMKGAIEKAQQLCKDSENSVTLQQFSNNSNPNTHYHNTAKEIIRDLGAENIDIFVAGVGTGGSITGVGRALKEINKNIKIIAAEPYDSAVLSGCAPSAHKIQGIGAGFVPKNLDTEVYGQIIKVKNSDAINMSRYLAKEEGLLVGISSGANVWAASILANKNQGKNILTFLCDTGERYLSTSLYDIS